MVLGTATVKGSHLPRRSPVMGALNTQHPIPAMVYRGQEPTVQASSQ